RRARFGRLAAQRGLVAGGEPQPAHDDHLAAHRIVGINTAAMLHPGAATEGDAGLAHAMVPEALGIFGSGIARSPGVGRHIVHIDIAAAVATMAAAPIENLLAIRIESCAAPGSRGCGAAGISQEYPMVVGKVI